MKFIAFGLNHETTSLGCTEAFSLSGPDCRQLIEELRSSIDAEIVLLSTCNRTEFYLYGGEADAALVRERTAQFVGERWPYSECFEYVDEAAVRHILQVCVGARSMVPGDGQILAQMKEAYERAVDADTVDMVMHRLMHTAFRAAKKVASETDLSSGAASVSSAAIAMAQNYFDERSEQGLAGRHVVLIGVGQMGQLALESVQRYRPGCITIVNRSSARARKVAEKYGADVAPWEARYRAMADADLVLVATGAPEPVVLSPSLEERAKGTAPALIIDIARPRNVSPRVDRVQGYAVRDLDHLQAWIGQVRTARREQLPTAEEICEQMLSEFVAWVFHQEALQPAIDAIRSTFETIRRQEIERHAHRFSEADRADLNEITQSILQKLLAVPIVRLKSVDPDDMDFVRGIKLLSTLFSRPAQPVNRRDTGTEGCPIDGQKGSEDGAAQPDEALDIEQLRRILTTLRAAPESSSRGR